MPENDRPAFLSDELLSRLEENGFWVVPRDAPDAALRATDDDGDRIFDGGKEHYFRNENEALWYGRQVWRRMIEGARIR